jgi:hypothetical protein
MIVGTESRGELPIHDRWWLTKGAGLRLGKSFGTLGLNTDCEISSLSPDEAQQLEAEVDQYLQGVKREHANERLLFTWFNL